MKSKSDTEFDDVIVDTVISRLRSMPSNAIISVGDDGKMFSISDLIKEVTNNTEIGKEIVGMQLMYLRSYKKR